MGAPDIYAFIYAQYIDIYCVVPTVYKTDQTWEEDRTALFHIYFHTISVDGLKKIGWHMISKIFAENLLRFVHAKSWPRVRAQLKGMPDARGPFEGEVGPNAFRGFHVAYGPVFHGAPTTLLGPNQLICIFGK